MDLLLTARIELRLLCCQVCSFWSKDLHYEKTQVRCTNIFLAMQHNLLSDQLAAIAPYRLRLSS